MTADASGAYRFTNIVPGEYNVVVRSGNQTVTLVVTVTDADKACDFVLPVGTVSSVVEVKPGTPAITVKGLDREAEIYTPADDESVEIRLIAQATETPEAVKEAIQEVHLTSLDMTVTKTVSVNGTARSAELIPETNTVLEILVPFRTAGRANLTVYRTHDKATTPMTKLTARPAEDFTDGTYFVGSDYIAIYTQKFSVYTIGYDVEITLDANGGTVAATTVKTDADGKAELPDAARKDYTFLGWYTEQEGGEQKPSGSTFDANTTLYAHWSYVPFQVKLDSQGGFVTDSAIATKEGNVLSKTPETPRAAGDRAGYHFSGWFTESKAGQAVTETTVFPRPAEDGEAPTIYAHWYVNVTFDPNGGTGETATTQTDMDDHLLTLPKSPSRDQYRFDGWYTERDGGSKVTVDSTAKFTQDTTLYAHWSYIPVTVTFNPDGGTVTPKTMQTVEGGKLEKKLPTPTRSGYRFQGWYDEQNQKVDDDTIYTSNTTLTAHWKRTVSLTGNPSTGDQAPIGLAVAVLALAAAGLIALVVVKKRKK